MALRQAKLCNLLRRSGLPLTGTNNAVALVSVEGHRHLTTNPTYEKPFDYKKRGFRLWHTYTDFTTSRINENSRIIMIEGPPSIGKSELAKALADRFKLLYMPAITDDDLFNVNGFDTRQLNEMLPLAKMRKHDLSMFYSEQEPENLLNFGATQIQYFNKRLVQYIDATRHVLNTGQGVVLENSVYSDACYALTMAEFGYFSKQGIRWYMNNRKNSLLHFWKPHLLIYLDAPSPLIVKNIKEKNPHYEGSPALSEKYFDVLKKKFKDFYVPFMSKYMDTLYYDATNLEDIDLLTLDLEGLDLIARYGDSRFMDWRRDSEEDYTYYRKKICGDTTMEKLTQWKPPYNCPELYLNVEESKMYDNIILEFPQLAIDSKKYWYDCYGKLRDRSEARDDTPLSLAKDSVIAQGVLEAGPERKAIGA